MPEVPARARRWATGLVSLSRRDEHHVCGLYLTGSICTGGFNSVVSDLDLVMVVESPLADDALARLRSGLIELGPPPAAGGLDLDVFTRTDLRRPARDLRWQAWIRGSQDQEAQIQTRGSLHLSDWAPALAIARQHAVPVFGPPSAEVIGPIPHPLLLAACREELAGWGDNYEAHWSLPGGVLTACRAWWYWDQSGLGSKVDAGRWALGRVEDPAVVQQALDHQLTGAPHNLTAPAAIAFVRDVAARIAEPSSADRP